MSQEWAAVYCCSFVCGSFLLGHVISEFKDFFLKMTGRKN